MVQSGVTLEYLGAVERKEFHRIKELLAPDPKFNGPSAVMDEIANRAPRPTN
jgi:hypothetical protein